MKPVMRTSVETRLAWRNVWKNKRRTVLTLLTVMVGCAMIIYSKAIHKGSFEQMIDDAISAKTGHIQIHEKGFWENMSIDYAFIPGEAMIRALDTNPDILAYSRRVHAAGLVSGGGSTEGALIQAVDPAAERRVTRIHSCILPGGRYLVPGDKKNVIMGETIAKNLSIKVGDSLSMISQGFDGSFAADNFIVVGLIRSGNMEIDRSLIVMTLDEAMERFTMMGNVSSIAIRLKDGARTNAVRDELRKSIGAGNREIMGWEELMPEMLQMISFQDVTHEVLYYILFLIVAFGVLNTIQMSVYERIRELGIMLAIGTRPGQVRLMVLIESVFISMMGIALGIILGTAISYYFTIHPLDYSSYQKEMEAFGMTRTFIPAKIELIDLVSTSLAMFLLSIVFTFFPALRASRLRPVEAIRKL